MLSLEFLIRVVEEMEYCLKYVYEIICITKHRNLNIIEKIY